MSVLKAIHDLWGTKSQLTDLVPSNKVFTGEIPDDPSIDPPYVSINFDNAVPLYESGGTTRTEEQEIDFFIVAATSEKATEIGDTVLSVYDIGDLILHADAFMAIYETSRGLESPEIGVWVFRISYKVFVERSLLRVT